ncbi:MAG: DUF4876 domain-containing protein [Tannerella sp.]|jgi:hypothetical protein|nr:DUF4876 domain-containing protein [Tannerella sp.]
MKKIRFYFYQLPLLCIVGSIVMGVMNSCKDEEEGVKTFTLKVQLKYPDGYQSAAGVEVKLNSTLTDATFKAATDATGTAEFLIVAGTYQAIASETRIAEGNKYVLFNGTKSDIVVANNSSGSTELSVTVDLTESKTSALVIKELYNGGCQKDDGSGSFTFDQYVVLYNNSDAPVSLKNITIAACMPSNGHATNNFITGGELTYKTQGWIPAGFGLWTLERDVQLAPGKQIVISMENSIDNTQTYKNSINFANPEYYACYDVAVFPNTSYYKISDVIPTDHYLKGYKFAGVTANAYVLSVSSPAFFVFQPAYGVSFTDYVTNADNIILHGGSTSQANLKTPVEWVIDGIEVFQKGQESKSVKRLTEEVDAGFVYITNNQGYTLYRNVDKTLTEAIAENEGKIVYSYSGGIEGSTDASGIDAEASIKNGARIVYKDTNNSTNDFHIRAKASIKN